MSDDRSSDQGSKNWLERLVQAFSNDHEEPSTRTELIEFLRQTAPRFDVDAEGLAIIEGAFEIGNRQVREVMVQRSQIEVIRVSQPPSEYLPLIIHSGHSRYPVVNDDLDDIIGILLVKDLLPLISRPESERDSFDLHSVVRPATFIPESKRLNSLLKEFRDTHSHMAIVVDEYGGTAGIITIEDILEQIVGDIEDEHDIDEDDEIRDLGNQTYAIKAILGIEDFNEHFGTDFSDQDFDTIGGLVMQRFGHLPERGESTELDGWKFTVTNADNRRLHWLKLERLEQVVAN